MARDWVEELALKERLQEGQVAKKGGPNLSVGSMSLLDLGEGYPAQVRVSSRMGGMVKLEISFPVRPKVCDCCGHGRNLSVNPITGVVVCMTSHQGMSFYFGYDPPKTRTVKLSDLEKCREVA